MNQVRNDTFDVRDLELAKFSSSRKRALKYGATYAQTFKYF